MMKIIHALALLVLLAESIQTMAVADTGLCDPTETRYFNCLSSHGRWISLCGNVPDTLQYRFGRSDKVELRYPENPAEGKGRFLFAHYFRFQTDRVEVGFRNQGVDYAIFDYHEEGHHYTGVHVTTADGKESAIACAKQITSRLLELKPILPCDEDNALNVGQCP